MKAIIDCLDNYVTSSTFSVTIHKCQNVQMDNFMAFADLATYVIYKRTKLLSNQSSMYTINSTTSSYVPKQTNRIDV